MIAEKFKSLCHSTFNLYIEQYSWYPMSPTVHKILVHGYQIINQFIVPVGVLGENASEARNKLYKSDRKSHARKCSRLANITDVFNRAMDSSEPLLSSFCLRDRSKFGKKKLLPKEVIGILQNQDAELYKSSYQLNNEEEEVEDEFNCLNIFLEEEVEE